MSQNSYLYAFSVVFLAGIFWSFGALTVRYMVDGHQYVFQYLFYRGLTISIILLIYLFFREGFAFYKNFRFQFTIYTVEVLHSFILNLPHY